MVGFSVAQRKISNDTSTDHSDANSKSDNDDYNDVYNDDYNDADEDNELDLDDDHDASDQVMKLELFICVFHSFFRLCFRLSDKAPSFLLKLMSILIKHLCSLAQVLVLIIFAETFPSTLYMLRKNMKFRVTRDSNRSMLTLISDRFVSIGKKVKFIPYKPYVYYSIIDSIQQLVSRRGF